MIVIDRIQFEDQYLLVELSGDYVLDKAKHSFIDILEVCVKHQVKKLFIDATKIQNKITVLQSEEYGFFMSKFKNFNLQLAFLSREENIHAGKPLEKTAIARGFNIKVGSDRNELLAWLTAQTY